MAGSYGEAALKDLVVVLSPQGDLDLTTAPSMDPVVSALIDRGVRSLALHLDRVGFIGSRGIGYILNWWHRMQEKGGRLVVASAPPNVKAALQAVGAYAVIPMTDTLPEALRELHTSIPRRPRRRRVSR